jgi:hypothetical protein
MKAFVSRRVSLCQILTLVLGATLVLAVVAQLRTSLTKETEGVQSHLSPTSRGISRKCIPRETEGGFSDFASRWAQCGLGMRRRPRLPATLSKRIAESRSNVGNWRVCTAMTLVNSSRACRLAGRFFTSRKRKVQYMGIPKVASTHLRRLVLVTQPNPIAHLFSKL